MSLTAQPPPHPRRAGWAVGRLKFRLLKVEQGWSPQCDSGPAAPGEWGVLKVGCVNGGNYNESENKALPPTLDPPPELEVRAGDVLMSRSNTSELVGAVGRVSRTQGRILLCDKLYRLTFDERHLHPAYAVYLLQSQHAREQIERDATGASSSMKNISVERVGDLQFAYPPVEVQMTVCAFLDAKTIQFDEVVLAKNRMLELLREKRQALVTRLVTRGLDAGGLLKDSGFAWLEKVPERWSVERLKFSLSLLEQGWSPQCDSRPADENEWGVLKAGCVNGGSFNEAENKVLPENEEPILAFQIRPGDVLVSRASGSPELVGSAALVKSCRPRLLLCDKLFRLHCLPDKLLPAFAAAALNSASARAQVEQSINGAEGLANNITQTTLRNLVLPLPPVDEQARIVRALDDSEPGHVRAVTVLTEQLAKLREHRQALITAAVMGQLDVTKQTAV